MLTGTSRHIDTPRRQGAEMALRREVSKSWNLTFAQQWLRAVDSKGNMVYYRNRATPFRAVMNNQDPLNRQQYRCANGFLGPRKWFESCDGTNVPAVSGNQKQYWPQTDYVRFKAGTQVLIERNRDVYNRPHNIIRPSSSSQVANWSVSVSHDSETHALYHVAPAVDDGPAAGGCDGPAAGGCDGPAAGGCDGDEVETHHRSSRSRPPPAACLLSIEEWVVTGPVQPKVEILRTVVLEGNAARVFVVVPDPSGDAETLAQYVVSAAPASARIVPWIGDMTEESRSAALRALFAVAATPAPAPAPAPAGPPSVMDSFFSYLDNHWSAFGLA